MFALSRRRNACEVVVKPKVSKSQDAYTIFHSLMGELPNEEFWMLLLNLLEISVSDHIIVANDVYYFFADVGAT